MLNQPELHDCHDPFCSFESKSSSGLYAQFPIHNPSAEAEEENNKSSVDTGPHGRSGSGGSEPYEFVLQGGDCAGQDKEEEKADPAGTLSSPKDCRLQDIRKIGGDNEKQPGTIGDRSCGGDTLAEVSRQGCCTKRQLYTGSKCRKAHFPGADQEQIQCGEDGEKNGQDGERDRAGQNFTAQNLVRISGCEKEHVALGGIELPVKDVDAEQSDDEYAEGGCENKHQRSECKQGNGSCENAGQK